MKIRLADPLPVSASFRISRSGMEIMRHLACLRQRFHCMLQPSWKRARLATAMPREQRTKVELHRLLVVLFVCFRFPPALILDSLPGSILIHVAKQDSSIADGNKCLLAVLASALFTLSLGTSFPPACSFLLFGLFAALSSLKITRVAWDSLSLCLILLSCCPNGHSRRLRFGLRPD